MSGFGAALGRFFSRGDAGISVPAMDGVFRPNNRLETAERLLSLDHVDNLAAFGGGLVASAGDTLHQIKIQGSEAVGTELRRSTRRLHSWPLPMMANWRSACLVPVSG